MYASLIKLQEEDTGYVCAGKTCQYLPEYHDQILDIYFLKTGTTVLKLLMSNKDYYFREMYCQPCIKILYQELKPLLDINLWVLQ